MTYIIQAYTPALAAEWDRTVKNSRNATFLLLRSYMDYHADRFSDRSLLVRDGHGDIAALFAAADAPDANTDTIIAHPGLTYGGLVLPYGVYGEAVLQIFDAVAGYYQSERCRTMLYRAIPHIYHRYPAEEDIYAIFRRGGSLSECSLSSTYVLGTPPVRNENTRRNIARGLREGITVSESHDYTTFYRILCDTLAERHGARPVHSLTELQLLAARFPDNIRLYFAVGTNGEVLAATLLYLSAPTVHAQYICSTPAGRDMRALPVLFNHLMQAFTEPFRYFDFGTSCENHGLYLNEGLIRQKSTLGARGIAYCTYKIDL